jgi:hypothetical protein
VSAVGERRRHDVTGDLRSRGWATIDLAHLGDLGAADALGPTPPPVVAVLEGVTAEAQGVLGRGSLRVTRFPYSVERGSEADRRLLVSDARLLLPDHEPFRVSRRHCMLLREEDRVWVVDTSSRLGTSVNGTMIGGATGRVKAELLAGRNEVAIGGPRMPYRFRVTIEYHHGAGGERRRGPGGGRSRASLLESAPAPAPASASSEGGDHPLVPELRPPLGLNPARPPPFPQRAAMRYSPSAERRRGP